MNKLKHRREHHKKIRKQPKNDNNFVFHLRKLTNQKEFQPVFTNFSWLPHQDPTHIKRYYPFYLKDNKAETPSFVIPVLGYFDPTNNISLPSNQLEGRENPQKEISVTLPEPDPTHRVCGVCKKQYEQYFSHIESNGHKNNVSRSVYQKYIKNFCMNYYGQQSPCLKSIQSSQQMTPIILQ